MNGNMNKKVKSVHWTFGSISRYCLCVLMLSSTYLCSLILVSCERRDPQVEYELLSQTIFSTPKEGEEATQNYINDFRKNKNARIAEVSEMRHQYQQISVFLSNRFNSYADFLDQTRELNKELTHSDYFGVQKMWTSLYGEKRDRLLGELLDSITESDFEDYFKKEVWKIIKSKFLEVESIDQMSISLPIIIKNGTAKKSTGEYRIHLRGKYKLNSWYEETDRMIIEGAIVVDDSGNLTFVRMGYQVFD